MKSIIKSVIIAAVLIAAPAHAIMFRHADKAFRTAVMNRSLTTRTPGSVLASIHQGRKPLTAIGALIGLGSTGYLVQQARKPHTKLERHFDCFHDIARFTYNALEQKNTPAVYKAWMNERAQVFNHCQKSMSKATREELYALNISCAQERARGCRTFIDMFYEKKDWPGSYFMNVMTQADLYEKTAQQLRQDLQKEQEHNRRIENMMLFWPV